MKLDSPRKLFLLALILGAGGLAGLAFAKGDHLLELRAERLLALAIILGFVFFPWRLFEREYWARRRSVEKQPEDPS
jgi:hypothetical protein